MPLDIRADGTIIAPLDKDWKIVSLKQAVLLKVTRPDGRVIFYRPKKETTT